LYDLLETLYPIIKRFVLIGSGDDWERVIGFCKEKEMDFESFYKKDHEFTIDYLQKFNGIGLAPYNTESKWTFYCSPLKVSEYISCGVPVLMSGVPEIAELVEKEGYGVTYDELDFEKIKKKLEDFDTGEYYKKAKKFYGDFNHEVLFEGLGL
jgi:glycosyltransferase involved in cell wall biosynthesis